MKMADLLLFLTSAVKKNILIISFIALLGGAIHQNADALSFQCASGNSTTLAAEACVNIWEVKNPQFKWADIYASCKSRDSICESLRYQAPKTLRVADCRFVKIVDLVLHDHLAKIQCFDPAAPSTSVEWLVNLDSLSCNPRNASNYIPKLGSSETPKTRTGLVLIARAEQRRAEIAKMVALDAKTLLNIAKRLKAAQLRQLLQLSTQHMYEILIALKRREGLDLRCLPLNGEKLKTGSKIRAQRTCRLFQITVDSGAELLRDHHTQLDLISTLTRTSYQLETRMLLLYAFKTVLPDLPNQLHLIRKATETGISDPADPSQTFFWELHSGFVYGGRRLPENTEYVYDCSDFVISVLNTPPEITNELSTLVLKTIAQTLSNERSTEGLSNSAKRFMDCFLVINPRNGGVPQPGDFVLSNSETFDNQHAGILKTVLPNQNIVLIEAAGGLINAIDYTTRSIYEDTPICDEPEPIRPMRPDIYILRLKENRPPSCPIFIS